MAYVVQRGNVFWYRVKLGGKWRGFATEYRVDQPNGRRNAQRYADRQQARIDASAKGTGTVAVGPLTVRRYALETWIPRRREADLDWKNDLGRLTHHVLPRIGDMPLVTVCAPTIVDLVHTLRFGGKLAQRSVYNVYSVVSALFRDAKLAGLIDQTPCELDKRQLGPIVDSDPEWRDGAVFTRDEAETLISDERIPEDRRLYYALGLLAGLRPGEIAALRWRHLDVDMLPLGRLTVAAALSTRKNRIKSTKTLAVRKVPVHPTLAAMLAEWRDAWSRMNGRAPQPDDLLLPLPPADAARRRSRSGEPIRTGDYAGKKWREVDLPRLGWRSRELYDTKSTFITLALEDGADPDVIEERVTHAKPRRSAFDGYDRGERWAQTCAEVSKLRIRRVTDHVTVVDSSTTKLVEAAGVEGSQVVAPANDCAPVSTANDNSSDDSRLVASTELSHEDVTEAILVGDVERAREIARRIAERENLDVDVDQVRSRR